MVEELKTMLQVLSDDVSEVKQTVKEVQLDVKETTRRVVDLEKIQHGYEMVKESRAWIGKIFGGIAITVGAAALIFIAKSVGPLFN